MALLTNPAQEFDLFRVLLQLTNMPIRLLPCIRLHVIFLDVTHNVFTFLKREKDGGSEMEGRIRQRERHTLGQPCCESFCFS